MGTVTFCCVLVFSILELATAKKPMTEEDCEVCVHALRTFEEQNPGVRDKSETEIEETFKKFCKNTKGDDERFCYYIGGAATSATNILKKMTTPFRHHLPYVKICEKLKSADAQICELKYEKKIDLTKIDFKKLKVKDLKKILADWNEEKACKGCSEKSDFVRAVKELMPKYAPEAYQKLKEREEL